MQRSSRSRKKNQLLIFLSTPYLCAACFYLLLCAKKAQTGEREFEQFADMKLGHFLKIKTGISCGLARFLKFIKVANN